MKSDLEKLVWKLQYDGLQNDAYTYSGIVYSPQGENLPLTVYSRYGVKIRIVEFRISHGYYKDYLGFVLHITSSLKEAGHVCMTIRKPNGRIEYRQYETSNDYIVGDYIPISDAVAEFFDKAFVELHGVKHFEAF